ncbi:MAG: hypothetical protein V8R51_06410 [Clostridia bacterium]
MQIKTASYQNILDSLCKVLGFDEQAILDIINLPILCSNRIIKY